MEENQEVQKTGGRPAVGGAPSYRDILSRNVPALAGGRRQS